MISEDGYHHKFRASKPEVDESPDQFIVQLDRYLLRWLELSKTDGTLDGLNGLIAAHPKARRRRRARRGQQLKGTLYDSPFCLQ